MENMIDSVLSDVLYDKYKNLTNLYDRINKFDIVAKSIVDINFTKRLDAMTFSPTEALYVKITGLSFSYFLCVTNVSPEN